MAGRTIGEVKTVISFENVSYSYEKGRPAVRNVSFRIQDGEAVGLIGANGAGKSTLMKLLLGLVQGQGRITVDGVTVESTNLPQVRRSLGCVLQNSDNQMFMPTVYEDMMFGPLNAMVPREEAERQVDEVLSALDITALKHRHNHRLSGGEKRMAAIATVLAMNPAAVLMDEPTSALDPYYRRVVIRAIGNMEQTKLIAAHDLDMIWDTCQRVILLDGGEIMADGPKETILRDKKLLEQHHMELPLRFQNV